MEQNKKNVLNIRKQYQSKSIFFQWGIVILCIIATSSVMLMYSGVMNSLKAERQSVMGVLYDHDPDAAMEYVNVILSDHVSKNNEINGMKAATELGYTNHAFENVPERHPVNYEILFSIFILMIFLLLSAGIFIQNKEYIDLCQGVIHALDEQHKHLLGYSESMTKRVEQIKDFIENIAHQIRTPISYVYLAIEDLPENDKTRQCINSLDQVKNLVASLLKIARLEADQVIFNRQNYNIEEIVTNICAEYADKSIELHITEDDVGSEFLMYHVDVEWFREAFCNLVNNALEHARENSNVEVHMNLDQFEARISITNQGNPIEKEDQQHIFDRFYTAKNVLYAHTGIGLNLASLIIQKHGGKIHLLSDANQTEFMIVLPRQQMTNKI